MKNHYMFRFQLVVFLLMFFVQQVSAQKETTTGADASIGQTPRQGNKYGIGVPTGLSKDATTTTVVTEAGAVEQLPTTPDIRKHPETGKVKLEGSPASTEVMELRDANSRTFKNPDGSYTKQQTKGVFHYLDAQGYWRTIGQTPEYNSGKTQAGIFATDLPIVINTTTGATAMQLDKKGTMLFGEDATLEYIDAAGTVVSSSKAGNALSNQLNGKELTLKGIWPGIDRKQAIDYYQVETDYIIQNRPSVQLPGGKVVFKETVTLPQGWKIVEGTGEETAWGWEGTLEIVNKAGEVKGTFERLVFFDSNPEKKGTNAVMRGAYTFAQVGNKVTLGVVVPADWLLAAERQYPVTIDPTATNTYASYGDLYYGGFTSGCQEQMNVNVPAGTITGTATSYTVRAYLDAWRSEQRSRVGVGATWTATQNGVGNSSGSYNYSLTGQSIANGAHGGGNITFTWQGYRTYFSYYDWFYCDYYTQELLSNTWVVTVTYTTSPCSGNPNPGTLAISATTACASTNYTLTSTGYTTTGSGLEYNFQHSDAGTGTWVDLTGWVALGGTNPTYTTNTTVAKDYRIQYRCNGGTAQNSNTVTHTPITCIYLNVNQQVQTTCAAKIYDSGGPSGNYSNNEARVVMIYPTAADQLLTVSGSYSTESGYDYISAIDGVSSDISSYLSPYFMSGTNTFSITAPGPGIPLTIKFQSDGGVVGAGFDLDVTCSCATPTAGTAVAQNIIECGETSDIYFSGITGNDYYGFASTSFVSNALPSGATISGNAAVTSEYVRLTSTAASQAGSLVFDNVNGLNGNALDAYFKMYAGGGSGADGMSFSFGPNISTTPGGSESGHGNGLKISFDSYNNGAGVQPNCNGTNYASVYLMYDNTVLGCYTTYNYTSWRNAWRLMVVSINENGQITVSNNEPGGPVYFSNVQLPSAYLSANKSTWKVAFSARTGGATDNHYVDDVNIFFGNQYEYSINNGASWSSATTFSGLGAGTYNPRVRNLSVTCGNLSLPAITISAPPALTAIPSVTNNGPICTGQTVALTATGMAPGGKVANLTGTQTINGSLATSAVNNFTMEFWVKPTATRTTTTQSNTGTIGTSNQRYAIWPGHGSTNAGAGVSVGTNGISVFEHGDGYMPSVLVHDFQSSITDWMHIAVVYNNRTPSLYINGVFIKTGVQSARANVYPTTGSSGGYGYFAGQIDAIRIWNDVRTQTEIRDNMYREAPANNTGLVVRYDFNASNVNAAFGTPNNTNGGATFSDADFYTYTWSGAGTFSSNNSTSSHTTTVTNPTSSTYTLTYNSTNNCGAVTGGTTAVTVNPIPSASISGTNTICAGGSSTFTASGGGTYAWSTGATTAAISVSTAGTYTVTVTNNGCTATASRTLTVTPLPSASVSGTNTICAGGSSTFTASGGGTYAWSTGATTAAISVSTAGTYTVTVTTSGCTATASRTLTVTPLPSASISGTNTICAGGSSTFTASGGGTYAWSTGATTAAISVSTAGTYTVTVTTSGCSATASRTLTVTPLPSASISGTNTICAGGSSTFTASGGGTYAWSTGASTAAISVSTAGTYTVTVTNNGCTATASRTLTVTPLPSASISGTNTICAGGSSTFTASGGGTYAWSTGATTAAISVSTAGTYTVTVTNNGCTATASRTLTVTPLPSASISGTNTICAGGSSTFTASGGGTYAWSTGASTAAISVSTAGTYTVTVTNNGCTATASRTLTVTPLPSASISGTNTICAGGSSTFTASGGGTYAWSTGASTAAISVSTAGTYTVTVTTSGCTATASRTLTVTPLPSASISGTNTICAGGSSTFTASGGGTYAWSTGASTAAISVSTAGTYTVTVTTSGCSATASRTLTVTSLPAASASNTGPYCVNSTISLTTTAVGGATYAWSGPSWTDSGQSPTRNNATTAMAGTYTVTVTASGCSATSSTTVTIDQPSASSINTIISPETIANGDYLWVGQTNTNWNNAANWYQFDGNDFEPAASFPTTTNDVFILPSSGCIAANNANVNTTSNVRDIHIATGATMTFGSSQRLNVYGDWTNNGAITNSGTSTVAFMGSATQTANTGGNGNSPNKRFAQIIVDKSGGSVIQNGAILMTSNFTLTNGIWDNTSGNAAVQVQGNWNNGGTGQFLAGTSTVTFNSSGARTITTGYTTGAPTGKTFYSISKAGTGVHTLAGDLVGGFDLSITAGTISTSSSGFNIDFGRDVVMRGGTLSGENSTISAARYITVGNTSGNGTLTCSNCVLNATSDVFVGVVAGNTGTVTLTNTSTLNAGRDILLRNGSFTANDATLNVTRHWTNSGATFTAGTSTVNFQGTANATITSAGQPFYNVDIERNATGTTTTAVDDLDIANELQIVTGNLIIPEDVVGEANTVNVSTTGQMTLKQVTGGTKGGEFRTNP